LNTHHREDPDATILVFVLLARDDSVHVMFLQTCGFFMIGLHPSASISYITDARPPGEHTWKVARGEMATELGGVFTPSLT
jgi:hypothetical protein